jgi:hypothetical protein
MKIEEFRKRFAAAEKRKRSNWEQIYREAMELFCPDRENFYNQQPGQKKGRQVYIASPAIALDKASNNLHASLTPHQKKWIHLKPGRATPEQDRERAKASLEQITDVLFDHIWQSNFDLAISEFYKDLLIGTAVLMVTGTAKQPLIFNAVPIHELYIGTGALGTIDKFFRKYKVKYGDIEATWDDAVIDDDMKRLIKESPDKEVEVIEGTVPKRIKVFNFQTEREEDVDGFGYYVCMAKKDSYLVQREMAVSPWIGCRWSVLSGEEWGRGPAIMCLNDGKTLNDFIKLHMQSMQISVFPAYTIVDDGVINISAVRVGPGAMIPVSANDGPFGATIAPLRSGGNLQAGIIEVERLENSINEQMYTEAIGAVTLPVKTATEVSIRQEALSKRIGSAYGRLTYELVKPLVNACLYQLDRQNIINMNDFRVDGVNIAIDVVSPLALGQAQEEINNVMRFVEFGVSTFGPEAAMTFMKVDEVLRFVADELNIPVELRASKDEIEQAKLALAQQETQPNGQQQIV